MDRVGGGAADRSTLPRLSGAIAVVVGGLVLAGWAYDVAWLKSLAPGLATMKANTALAFVLAGGALLLLATGPPTSTSRLAAGRLCAGVAALIGLLTLGQYLLGWDLGIDQLLFADPAATLVPPGRMSPVTALNHILLGVALLLMGRESSEWLRQWLAVGVFALAGLALLGYAYGVESLYQVGSYASVALHTAVTFAILSLGILFARPGRGLVAILASQGPGGASARRLLPAAIAVPFLVGWLRLWGERIGLYNTPFGLALFALSNIVIFTLLMGWNARRLDQADSRRRAAEAQAHRVHRALRALSECNQILVRATQEEELLQKICQVVVELGGYRLAWVGYAEADEIKSVRPVAQAGYEVGYLETLNITWADSERGRGPTGTAIRSGRPVVTRDILTDPYYSPWREQALQRGYASSIALPLDHNGQMLGALNIYAAEPDAFDDEEVKLLTELADDLAYGIGALRTRQERERAEEQIERHAAELEARVAERTRQLAQANEQLKELDRLKSKFVGDVSYQLRTPIANLQVYLDLMARGKPEKQETYLAVARQEIRQLRQFISNVLDMSRLSISQASLQFKSVDMNALVEQIANVYALRAEAAGLFLSCVLDPAVPPVSAERNLLGEAISHLLDNAIHYTVEGEVQIRTTQSAGQVCVSVSDTGVGVSDEDLPYIFDHFYRGQSANQLNVPGAGLGLGIVKEIVTLHGGQVDVVSQAGVGSTFRVCLPVV